MKFDIVHDIQQIYRNAIACFSMPGTILSLKAQCGRMDYTCEMNKAMLAIAIMLLDREVSFNIASEEENIKNFLTQLTYSKYEEVGGDYIFICKGEREEIILELIRKAKVGTLIDPHKSATLIIEVDTLTEGAVQELSGPGIEMTTIIRTSLREAIWELREEKNAEFPLGVDMILVDQEYKVVAIPRTTKVRVEGAR